jgi:8-oxo-dGTP pyrophosphatase MutT (NUDIX family)
MAVWATTQERRRHFLEYNDIYDENRRPTGRLHRRGSRWRKGEFGLVVCVWVYDGKGNLLLTRRAPQKSFAGTWENSGGAAKAGETSRQAIARELFEETGIRAEEEEFELLESGRDGNTFYDYYCIKRSPALSEIVLLPGETDDVKWVTMDECYGMVQSRAICKIIGQQFLRQAPMLKIRQDHQD